MIRSRLWLLAAAPILAVAILATQHFALAQASDSPIVRGFENCSELHRHYVKLAVASAQEERHHDLEADAMGEGQMADDDSMGEGTAAQEREAVAEPAGETSDDQGEVSETGTNIQERGVDESDIIKTDGTYFYILRPQSLLIAEISEEGPLVEVGRIAFRALGHRQELLIGNGTAVVVRQLNSVEATLKIDDDELAQPRHALTYLREQSEILEIDIGEATSPRLLRELNLEGRFLSARLVGNDLRVAMHHSSVIPYIPQHWFVGGERQTKAERYNEALQSHFRLGQWFPLFGFQDHTDNTFKHGYALDCSQTFAPIERLPTRGGEYPSTAFMISFDIGEDGEGIGEWGSVAVLGMAPNPTVYASQDSLYLAVPHGWSGDTAIHRFLISDPLEPRYFAGTIVNGRLLSQWSLSEHNGYLRVATTDWSQWPTVSSVTVLQPVVTMLEEHQQDDSIRERRLERVGQVTGLGKTESIFAVRFSGDVGYVVTFRQVDPLYVLDLSDPRNPKQVGELKIPGFSRYLHPLSGGLLFGVGRDADPRTGRERGLQATLFDVSDPANPTQISVLPLGDDAYSPVESDHRAFRYQDRVAWIPVGPDNHWLRESHDGAFFGVRVSSEGLSHESTLRVHGEALRALPVGERIHLLSSEEIRTYGLTSYEDLGSLTFPPEWDNRWLPIVPE